MCSAGPSCPTTTGPYRARSPPCGARTAIPLLSARRQARHMSVEQQTRETAPMTAVVETSRDSGSVRARAIGIVWLSQVAILSEAAGRRDIIVQKHPLAPQANMACTQHGPGEDAQRDCCHRMSARLPNTTVAAGQARPSYANRWALGGTERRTLIRPPCSAGEISPVRCVLTSQSTSSLFLVSQR